MKYILCLNDEMKQCQSCFIFNDIIIVLLEEKMSFALGKYCLQLLFNCEQIFLVAKLGCK
jgi:hypothetical protein